MKYVLYFGVVILVSLNAYPTIASCMMCEDGGCVSDDIFGDMNCWTDSRGCHLGGGDCAVVVGCFREGTLVETLTVPKQVEDLEVGDIVLSKTDRGERVYNKVTRTYRAISLENHYIINGELQVTGSHPFFVGSEWVPARDLKVGDRMEDMGGEIVEVSEIRVVDFATRVYNIEVGGDHTFYAGGILVHNKPGTPHN